MKKRSGYSQPPSSAADLERAIEKADDARDIAKDMLRQLPDYDGNEEESTARHEMPQQQAHVTVNVHHPSPSKPDVEVEASVEIGPMKVTGLPKWAIVGISAAVAIVVAVWAHLTHR